MLIEIKDMIMSLDPFLLDESFFQGLEVNLLESGLPLQCQDTPITSPSNELASPLLSPNQSSFNNNQFHPNHSDHSGSLQFNTASQYPDSNYPRRSFSQTSQEIIYSLSTPFHQVATPHYGIVPENHADTSSGSSSSPYTNYALSSPSVSGPSTSSTVFDRNSYFQMSDISQQGEEQGLQRFVSRSPSQLGIPACDLCRKRKVKVRIILSYSNVNKS